MCIIPFMPSKVWTVDPVVMCRFRITSAETAQLILFNNALSGVVIRLGIDRDDMVRDDYDPRSKTVWLSLDNFIGEL